MNKPAAGSISPGQTELRIRVTRPMLPARREYDALLDDIWASGILTNEGPCLRRLTSELSDWLNVEHLQLVASGASALQLALDATEATGSVVTTPFTFAATTNAIVRAGLRPIFADIDPVSLCLSPQLAEQAIESDTSAILATHVFGVPCALAQFDDIAVRKGLKILYDGAHVFGTMVGGKSLASYGDATAMSFHATKLFHTVEGGAVITRTAKDSARVGLAKSHGIMGSDVPMAGINAKMSELHAAFGLNLLPGIAEDIRERAGRFDLYRQALEGSPAKLCDPDMGEGSQWNYAYCPTLFGDEASTVRAQAALRRRGIEARRYFYPALNTLPYYSRGCCPVAEDVSKRILCLPFGSWILPAEIEEIAEIIEKSAGNW